MAIRRLSLALTRIRIVARRGLTFDYNRAQCPADETDTRLLMTDKTHIADFFDRLAPDRSRYFRRNRLYHDQIVQACRPFLNEDSRVLELGCSTGDSLAALSPRMGVGIDISPQSIAIARQQHPAYTWLCADVEALPDHEALRQPFDVIVIEDLLGYLDDIQGFFEQLRPLMHAHTRLIIGTWNWIWRPVLSLGERLGAKAPDFAIRENWISASAIRNLLTLTHFQTLETRPGILFPYHLPPISGFINSLSYAPLIQRLPLLHVVVARPLPVPEARPYSVSVIIPTRNEKGNIADLVTRTPMMGSHTELLFIDGNSTDGTIEEIQHWIAARPDRAMRFMAQDEASDDLTPPNLMLKKGKGDAVRKAFAAASGDILMILDSDISVPPEDLTRFYSVLATHTADFANGTRFLYEQQEGAMPTLNRLGNVAFTLYFSWLFGQKITDTLCGTKVLFRHDYETIARNRAHFGNFDPFGDFDLLFGAAWQGHRLLDVPIRYQARVYGESKVRVGTHGPLLGRMSLVGLWHFKLRPMLTGQRAASSSEHEQPPLETLPSKVYRRWGVLLAVACLVLWWLRRRRS